MLRTRSRPLRPFALLPHRAGAYWLLPFLCFAAWGETARSQAAMRGPALNWVRMPGADSCIAPVELAQRVEGRLGRAVFVRASDAIVVVEGRIGPSTGGGFAVVLQVSDPDGTVYGSRELESPDPDCRKLDDVVALIIAVTLRRERVGVGGIDLPQAVAAELDRLFAADPSELDPESLPPTAVLQPSAAGAEPPASVAAAAPAPSASRVQFELDVTFTLSTGLQPSVTLAPALRVRLARAALGSVGLETAFSLPRDDAISGSEEGWLHTSLWYAGAVLCGPPWRGARFELHICGAGRFGRLRVEAREFIADNDTRTENWFELGPELDGRVLFDPLYVTLSIGVPFRIVAPLFRYIDTSGDPLSALSVARTGLRAAVGVGLRF